MVKKTILEGELIEDKVLVSNSTLKGTLVGKGFGESKGRELVLDLYEALFLVANKKIVVKRTNKKIKGKELLTLGLTQDKKFYSKSLVFSDIRERGQVVKTGLKFGFDFRV